jgi:hypothetical protein
MKYIVCIRYAGEESYSLCHALIQDQVDSRCIVKIEEKPFYKSMLKSFEIANSKKAKYLIAVDADVFLRNGIIHELISIFEGLPNEYCEIQGKIFDKFFGGERSGGIHMYNMSHYHELIRLTGVTCNNIRPERDLLLCMRKNGFPTKNLDLTVGLHDYNQSYKDIYRKCFVHSFKHLHLSEYLIPFWKKMALKDEDYVVALKGFSDGIKSLKIPKLDTSDKLLEIEIDNTYPSSVIVKGFNDIDRILQNNERPKLFYKYFPKSNMSLLENIMYKLAEYLKIISNKLFRYL